MFPDSDREAARSLLLDPHASTGTDDGIRVDPHDRGDPRRVDPRHVDPRRGIESLDDATPILLLPLRVETRFAPDTSELLVRVFPDDVHIDTFDPELTDNELAHVRDYWARVWAAAGSADRERGAWRILVQQHGSGRSRHLITAHVPSNPADRPAPAPGEVALVVPTQTALGAGEATAVTDYWTAVWSGAAGADAGLVAAVGQARAEELRSAYRPVNLDDREGSTAIVRFAVFPAVTTRAQAWSVPPSAGTLPDRFVVIGYHGSDAPVIAMGRQVPPRLVTGPDPAATGPAQLRHGPDGELILPPELRWIAEFDREPGGVSTDTAVDLGMGIRVPLTPEQARDGFDRLIVIGLRLGGNGTADLAELLRRHAVSRSGVEVLAQGKPTNNTEEVPSGHSRTDDADASFDVLSTARYTLTSDWSTKRDGQWLAEYLGLDPAFFAHTAGADGTDQQAGRAMNRLLWPATLGYWMTTMMAPVFGETAIEQTRQFLGRYVLGSGAVPALRIGNQPYGILPATVFSRMAWLDHGVGGRVGRIAVAGARSAYLRGLYAVLDRTRREWTALAGQVSHVGGPGDPHRVLLDIVGLHPGSVEWWQRTSESLETLFNRLSLHGLTGIFEELFLSLERQQTRDLLTRFGVPPTAEPKLLGQIFDGEQQLLKGGVVDDRPLSETVGIRAYTDDKRDYLAWLADAARTGIEAVYEQKGFTGNIPPRALLYLLARHALQLGYHETGVRLHVDAGLYAADQVAAAYRDDPFLHIRSAATLSESRYQPLLAATPVITGSPALSVSRFIALSLATLPVAGDLSEQIAALDLLRSEPTARLERVFADHMDACSYRLDAWLLGLVHHQLALMRGLHGDIPAQAKLHLGGYAWLENLRPKTSRRTPVTDLDPQVAAAFATGKPLMRDPGNEGFIHAPSLNHAVAAAVLRNGYIAGEGGGALAVNLTSARVRVALGILEGIRAGQSMSDLLGYQFERGLHDRSGGPVEADRYIYELRKAFPLRANRINSTLQEGVAIESIEARNVVDGLALAEAVLKHPSYPFGRTDLPAVANPDDQTALDAEAALLRETQDAVADVALAEGVYQAVLGNYDRVASTYDAYAHGAFPPEPEIVQTPLPGIGLTSRVALHLDPSASATVSPVGSVEMTPRAVAEPSVNAWLAGTLPPLNHVGCVVDFTLAATGAEVSREILLDQLHLQPADLLAIVRDDADQAMSELDDRVVHHAMLTFGPSPAAPVRIRYAATLTAPISVFETMPVLRSLRRLITASRALEATDLTPPAAARSGHDAAVTVDQARLTTVAASLAGLRNDLGVFAPQLGALVAGQPARREELLTGADTLVGQVVGLLSRAAMFGLPQSGWGFAYAARDRAFAAFRQSAADLVTRWQDRVTEHNARLADVAALDPAAPDAERMRLLAQAERAIVGTPPITPGPATPAAYQVELASRLATFQARLAGFQAIATSTATGATQLRAAVRLLLPIEPFDTAAGLLTDAITKAEDGLVQFARDAFAVITAVHGAAVQRVDAANSAMVAAGSATTARDRFAELRRGAKALLGEDFTILPRLTLDGGVAAAFADAYAASQTPAPFAHLTSPPPGTEPVHFPVDTWLHGVARVRDKLAAWERLQLMTEALGTSSPDGPPQLDALQLPWVTGEPWLGLHFPDGHKITSDRLLYTAHFAVAPPSTPGPICGLLLDEWSEVVPGDHADTGLAFHFDRPSSEAPQTMLLVTPPQFTGSWRFDDLVAALNETLDLAKLRGIEPHLIGETPAAPLLPATMMATQSRQLTIAANLALNNVHLFVQE